MNRQFSNTVIDIDSLFNGKEFEVLSLANLKLHSKEFTALLVSAANI
jgi:hypothetical protein